MSRVPKLRFKEFSGEWEDKHLIELSENGFSNGAFNDPKKVGYGYRIINVKDMYVDGTINVDNLTRVGIDEKEFLKNRVEYGDIFFTRSSLVKEGIAYSNVNLSYDDDLTFDGHLIRMRPIKEQCLPLFLYYNFTTANARKQFIIRGKTTTMTTIGQEDIASVVITLPKFSEQQKIASFLSTVDTKIDFLTRKKELLEQYKKGVMQKIFSQELRFKADDGSAFPEWEEKKLGEIATKKSSNISANKIENNFGDYIIYGAAGVLKKVDFFEEADDYISIVKDGAGVGRIFYCKGKSSVLGTMDIIKPKIGLHTYFLYCLLENIDFVKYVTGSTIPHIYFKDYSNETCGLPSLGEQKKIANFLSAIDSKIDHMTGQLDEAKNFKKGLLQQMFV